MDKIREEPTADNVADVESLEDLGPADAAALLDSPEFIQWTTSFLTDRIPSLFLDRSLKILRANEGFCRMYGCYDDLAGMYFTRFYASFFDDRKSSELFRAILSPEAGFTWTSSIERKGIDRRVNVSKVWIMPIWSTDQAGAIAASRAAAPPRAYCAMCLDISQEHRQNLQDTFSTLLMAARLKDDDTGHHVERVNLYASALAQALAGKPEAPEVDTGFVESIGQVSALHDIGKIGTPDDILNKAGPLEKWERAVMEEHTKNGAYILRRYPNPMASEIALRHHERWDGAGYPHGLDGKLIALPARIVAVADVYDALRMRRPYKEQFSHQRTLETMRAERGSHFDPSVLDRFLAIADGFDEIFRNLKDPDE